MKYILSVVLATFLSVTANADSTCAPQFSQAKKIDFGQDKALKIVELAAMYRANYIKSEQGKKDLANMQRILNVKIVPQQVPGTPFYEVSIKKQLEPEILQMLLSRYPEYTVVYKLNQRMKLDRLNYTEDEIIAFEF